MRPDLVVSGLIWASYERASKIRNEADPRASSSTAKNSNDSINEAVRPGEAGLRQMGQ